jgi:RNA polymerase sigma-70 factor (ECF subfamily)
VAQEVFLRVFRHLGGFVSGRSFRGWLHRIAVNAAHDHRQHRLRRGARESGSTATCEEQPDGAPGAEARLRGREEWRRLEEALGRISERERAVFVLCALEGLSPREVAKTLGITSITVRRHLGRARASLKRLLEVPGEPKKVSPALIVRGPTSVDSQ